MTRHFLPWFGAMALATVAAHATALRSGIDRQLNHDLAEGQFSAAAILVMHAEQSRAYHYGQIDADSPIAVNSETAFEIGSITKVFTTTLLAQQVIAEQVSLDQTIGSLIGDRAALDPKIAAITLQQLATHQSGLPRLPGNLRPANPSDPYVGYDLQDLLSYLGSLQAENLEAPSAYSNLGSALLGQVLAMQAEMPYERLLKEQVLSPLGMTSSSFARDARHAAVGHVQGSATAYWNFNVHNPAGGLMSTLNDLGRFVDSYRVSPDASRQLAMRPQSMDNDQRGMALGWQTRRVADDDLIYWHNGATGGFSSMMAFRPSTSEAIVLLSNDSSYDLTAAAFIQLAAEADTATPPEYSDYIGHFGLTPSFSISVFERYGVLMARATGQPAFELTDDGKDQFTVRDIDASIRFIRDGAGEVGELRLIQNGREQRGPRIPAPLDGTGYTEIPLSPDEFDAYLGRYQLAPGIVIHIQANATHLTAMLTGQPAYTIYPHDSDHFFLKVADAQLEFTRDDDGAITGLILHQNGQQRARKLPDSGHE